MSRGNGKLYKRKKVIVFAYEGKNNKTESQYFSHFSPANNDFIIKAFPSGVTDPKNMVSTVKRKRSRFDYHASEDLTYIFMDGDCDKKKIELINELKKKLPKDIRIVLSNPCFELWFLNHFVSVGKEFLTNDEFFKELNKYIDNYDKNKDYKPVLSSSLKTAIKNSISQKTAGCLSYTDVVDLFENRIIK